MTVRLRHFRDTLTGRCRWLRDKARLFACCSDAHGPRQISIFEIGAELFAEQKRDRDALRAAQIVTAAERRANGAPRGRKSDEARAFALTMQEQQAKGERFLSKVMKDHADNPAMTFTASRGGGRGH